MSESVNNIVVGHSTEESVAPGAADVRASPFNCLAPTFFCIELIVIAIVVHCSRCIVRLLRFLRFRTQFSFDFFLEINCGNAFATGLSRFIVDFRDFN